MALGAALALGAVACLEAVDLRQAATPEPPAPASNPEPNLDTKLGIAPCEAAGHRCGFENTPGDLPCGPKTEPLPDLACRGDEICCASTDEDPTRNPPRAPFPCADLGAVCITTNSTADPCPEGASLVPEGTCDDASGGSTDVKLACCTIEPGLPPPPRSEPCETLGLKCMDAESCTTGMVDPGGNCPDLPMRNAGQGTEGRAQVCCAL